MTARATLFASLASLVLVASPVSARSADHATMLRQLDQVCSWTGLRRSGDLRNLHYWKQGRDAGCKAKLLISVEGKRADYDIEFRREQGALKFWALLAPDSLWAPNRSDWRGFKGIGFDTLKDPQARAFALAAVNKLNRHLRWRWSSDAAMQKIGTHILVVFETISPQQKKEPGWFLRYVDPYDSFVVSPKGTVIEASRTPGNDS
jgi:hypothetical protein